MLVPEMLTEWKSESINLRTDDGRTEVGASNACTYKNHTFSTSWCWLWPPPLLGDDIFISNHTCVSLHHFFVSSVWRFGGCSACKSKEFQMKPSLNHSIKDKKDKYCKYNHRHWSEVDRALLLQTPFVTCLPQMLPLLNCLPRHHHQEQHYQYSSINEYHTLHSSLSLFWQLLSNFNVFMLYKSWVIFDDKIYALKKKKSCQHKTMADNARQKSKKYKMISNGNARKRQSRPKKQRKKGQ